MAQGMANPTFQADSAWAVSPARPLPAKSAGSKPAQQLSSFFTKKFSHLLHLGQMAPEARDPLADSLQRFGLERGRMLAALARQAGISETDLAAIEHLEAAGPLTQRDLGARLALSSGAVTMLADRLERAGWVNRRPHPTDRRFVLLELSPQVAEQTPPALAGYHAAIHALAAKVPAEHRDALGAFLDAAARAAADAAIQISAPDSRRSGPP